MKQFVKWSVLVLLILCTVNADAKWPAVGSDVPGSTGQCLINDGGVVSAVACGAATGVAPADATYVVQTVSSSLSAEQSLGALTTGLLLNTVTASTGVLTTYAAQACTNQFVRGLSASAVPTCASVASTDITAMTSAALAGIISDETGTGVVCFATSPSFTTDIILGTGNGTATIAQSAIRGPNAAGTDIAGTSIPVNPGLGTGTGNIGVVTLRGVTSKQLTGTTQHATSGYLQIGVPQSAHPGAAGYVTSAPTLTITDEVTAASGTAALQIAHSFTGKTFAARNASVVSTDVATMYVTDSAAGTNNTATNVWSIIAGKSKFTSGVNMASLTAASGTPNSICQNDSTKEITVNAALTCTVSSRDQKDHIVPLSNSAINIVSKLRPASFTYVDNVNRERWGFIAEELQQVNPALADGYVQVHDTHNVVARSIDQNALLSVLVKAVQEQQAQIAVLTEKVQKLEGR